MNEAPGAREGESYDATHRKGCQMRYKATFVAGFAVGFIAGARAGRERYDQIVKYSKQVAGHPAVQKATNTVATKATDLGKTAAAKAPERLRIAVSRKVPPGLIARVSADQRGAWERMSHVLADLGHEVVERDPRYGLAQLDFVQTWMRGIYEESRRVPDQARLEPLTRQVAGTGRRLVPVSRRDKLLAKRATTTARILALWNEVDVLMTPGLATTAIAAASKTPLIDSAIRRPRTIAVRETGVARSLSK